MCYKYYFEKFKKNIFLIKFYKIDEENKIEKENNINLVKTLLIKFSYVDSYLYNEFNNNIIVSNTEYSNLFEKIIYHKIFRNFNIYTDLSIEIDDTLNLTTQRGDKELFSGERSSKENTIKFNINIDNLLTNDIIKHKSIKKLLNYKNINKINELILVIQEYDEYKTTLYQYFNTLNIFDYKLDIINKLLNNLLILHNDLNMIHGDLKWNNILVNQLNKNISFIDLEFSIFIKENELKTIKELELINYYLLLDDDYILSKKFLKLFDIYIFTLSFFIENTIEENHYIKYRIEKDIYKNLVKEEIYSNYFILFFILFNNIYSYFSKNKIYTYNTDENIFFDISNFNNIFNVCLLKDNINLCDIILDKELFSGMLTNENIFEDYDIINKNLIYIENIFNDLYTINYIYFRTSFSSK